MQIEDDAGSGFVFALASHMAHVAHTHSGWSTPNSKASSSTDTTPNAGWADSTAHPQEQSSPRICYTFPHNRVFEMIQLYPAAIHHRLMK